MKTFQSPVKCYFRWEFSNFMHLWCRPEALPCEALFEPGARLHTCPWAQRRCLQNDG